MADLKSLIDELEQAKEGSRELDRKVYWRLDLPRIGNMEATIPRYTTSLDAALTLVPEDIWWQLRHEHGVYSVEVGRTIGTQQKSYPALALCIAALKVRDQAIDND